MNSTSPGKKDCFGFVGSIMESDEPLRDHPSLSQLSSFQKRMKLPRIHAGYPDKSLKGCTFLGGISLSTQRPIYLREDYRLVN